MWELAGAQDLTVSRWASDATSVPFTGLCHVLKLLCCGFGNAVEACWVKKNKIIGIDEKVKCMVNT